MNFTSPVFLFYFLPLIITVHFFLPKDYKNVLLLAGSLFFYAWGELNYVIIMIFSIVINYSFGLLVLRNKIWLILAIALNLILLIYFKYFSFLFGEFLEFEAEIHLPIGISFFTFQGISYLVDVYRKEAMPEKSILNLGLYISLFPQLIAGPIVRYTTVMNQIQNRIIYTNDISIGIKRFIIGLAKKVFIANALGLVATDIIDANTLSSNASVLWFGIICYAFQIYYDFSGYSDMAIGLGRMLGFKFLENFKFPYMAKSIKDFWSRWHISLSTWFRDYLYIPLGGNRKGVGRTYVHLMIVFLLTGLWHGASWNFIVWGLIHGVFLMIEKINETTFKIKFPPFVSRFFTLLAVLIAWVYFRKENLGDANHYVIQMFKMEGGFSFDYPINAYQVFLFIIALLFSFDLRLPSLKRFNSFPFLLMEKGCLLVLFVLTVSEIAKGSYNPFIYFRF